MTLLPVGFGEFAIHWQRTGDPEDLLNVWGFANEVPATVEDCASIIAGIWAARFPASGLSSSMRLDRVVVKLANESGEPTVAEATIGINGSFSEQLLPQNCAVLVRKITARSGRKGRGRDYHPIIAESQVDNIGVVTPAVRDGITALFNNLVGDHDDANLPLHLLHSTPTVGLAPPPDRVTACICDNRIATQRRRLRP